MWNECSGTRFDQKEEVKYNSHDIILSEEKVERSRGGSCGSKRHEPNQRDQLEKHIKEISF